jgi:hypothetical protein
MFKVSCKRHADAQVWISRPYLQDRVILRLECDFILYVVPQHAEMYSHAPTNTGQQHMCR